MIKNKTIIISHGWSDISVNAQSKALALALSKNNQVFFLNVKKSGKKELIINDHLVVYEWPGKRPVGWKDFWFALKQIRQHSPDIIITHFASNNIMLFVAWIFGVKTRVCYFHTMVQQHLADHKNLSFRQRINIYRKGFIFRMATHMLCPSTAAQIDLVKFYRVKKNKIFVFPNAIPPINVFCKYDENKIGFIARLHYSKGADILIEAFKKIAKTYPFAELIIVGKGSEEKSLKEQVEKSGLNSKVFFRGNIPYNEILEFLASINFLVIPSRMDNLPTVALEALSVGTPLIGSNAGGIPDIIQSGYNGFLFENEDAEELSRKMDLLLASKEKRYQMSVHAKKIFEERYCTDNLPERFEELLEKKF